MPTLSLEEAQARLAELVDTMQPGEEIIITRNHNPVARLIGAAPTRSRKLVSPALPGRLLPP